MLVIHGSKLTGLFEKTSDQIRAGQQTKWLVDPWLETVFISGHFELLVTDLPLSSKSV